MAFSFSDTYEPNGLYFRLTQPDLPGHPSASLTQTA
jgi:hypothetical protein